MTIEQASPELLDLALELVYAGDAPNLTQALAIAEDLDHTLATVALDWNAGVCADALAANDFDTVFAALPF